MLSPAELQAPCVRLDIDVADGISGVAGGSGRFPSRCAWILVRIFTEPVGIVLLRVAPSGLSSKLVAEAISESLGVVIAARAGECGAQWPGPTPGASLATSSEPPFIASRRDVLSKAPEITVVVCTRERPAGLEACLKSLLSQEYPNFSILVVDNDPQSDASASVVAKLSSESVAIHYIVEPRRGLAWARNRALQSVSSGIAAWVDDDEVADPFWLAELARGFVDHPEAAAVSGIMLPAELETRSQIWFEQYGGHHKHRGFEAITFSPATADQQSPLYPLPPFGTGGNMALRVDAIREIGGFVTALGAGTWTLGGEDTRAISELLLKGGTVVYQPTAVTHHFDRRQRRDLRRQMFGYGVGLTAFYSDVIVSRPSSLPSLLRLIPRFLRESHGPESLRSGDLPSDFPTDLRWSNRLGLLAGPWRYLLARVIARRRERQTVGAEGTLRR
jgi:glycosyltransferase involved in cell wall biosynthesis